MKTGNFKREYIFLFGVLLFILSGFIPEKYAPGFKEAKKKTDTLTIINPIVQVVADNNSTKSIVPDISITDIKLIDSTANKLLSKKYFIEKAVTPVKDMESYTGLLQQLENSSESLVNVSSNTIFDKQKTICKSRYALVLIYSGQFHPDFPPHYKLHTAVMSGTVVITPNNPTRSVSDLRVLIIDTEIEQIVYYDRLNTSKYDARVQPEVIQMTKDLLKNIYYK